MKKIGDVRGRIQDPEVKKIFDKYKMYEAELAIYEQYCQENHFGIFYRYKLAKMYKEIGIEFESKEKLEQRFRNFASSVEAAKQENEGINLHDIRTQKNRDIISGLISQTQKNREMKSADLDPIAVIEYFYLYTAVGLVDEKSMSVQEVLEKFQITPKEFLEAQTSYKNYEKSGMIEYYNNKMKQEEKGKPNTIVHYAAGCLEITPAQTRNDLAMIKVLKKESFVSRKRVIEKQCDDDISQVLIDRVMMDQNLTQEEKQARIQQMREGQKNRMKNLLKEANAKGQNVYRIREEESKVINMPQQENDEREIG